MAAAKHIAQECTVDLEVPEPVVVLVQHSASSFSETKLPLPIESYLSLACLAPVHHLCSAGELQLVVANSALHDWGLCDRRNDYQAWLYHLAFAGWQLVNVSTHLE